MKYGVQLSQHAKNDIRDAYQWLARRSESGAQRWLYRLKSALSSLENLPDQHSSAPESEFLDAELRQMLFGKRAGCYRILFTIDTEIVRVHRVRNAARRSLTAEDFEGLD